MSALSLLSGDPGRAAASAQNDFQARIDAYHRTATLLERLARDAADSCPGESHLGIVFDHPAMYLLADRPRVGFAAGIGLPRVLAITESSPAALAGVRQGDLIRAVDGRPIPASETGSGIAAIQSVIVELRQAGGDGRIDLGLIRNGVAQTVSLSATAGCEAWIDLTLGKGMRARSKSGWIQLSQGLVGQMTDGELTFVLGHELGHIVLRRQGAHSGGGIERRVDAMALRWMLRGGYPFADAANALRKYVRAEPGAEPGDIRARISHLRDIAASH